MAVSPLEYWLVTLWRAGKLLVANCVHARPCYKAVLELALGFRGLGCGVAVTPHSLPPATWRLTCALAGFFSKATVLG